jgi:hypothetical protein
VSQIVTEKGDNHFAKYVRRLEYRVLRGLLWFGYGPLYHPILDGKNVRERIL